MTLSSGPWFRDYVRPYLVTSRFLDWAYPRLIPPARQAENARNKVQGFTVPAATLEGGLTVEDLNDSPVDVWVKGQGEKFPALLAEGIPTAGRSASGSAIIRTTLLVDRDQLASLEEARAYSRSIILRPHSPGPFAASGAIRRSSSRNSQTSATPSSVSSAPGSAA